MAHSRWAKSRLYLILSERLHKKIDCYELCFWLFLLAHTILWTIVPALGRNSLPHDALEGITWGLQWQLGYPKHPFFTAWLCAGITQVFGAVDWPIYLLAQLAVSTTFWAVWQLAKQLLTKPQALIATLAIEGVLFYNINSFNLTPDTMQSPLWALLSLLFYQAITQQKIRYWLLTGLLATLCLCTKYQAVVLLMSMMLLCFFDPTARNSFKKPGIYCGLLILCITMTPHLLWLYQHQFITLVYAQQATENYLPHHSLLNYLWNPVGLSLNALLDILGVFILIWPFYSFTPVPHQRSQTKRGSIMCKQEPLINEESIALSALQHHFLYAIAYGPLIITLFLSFIFGSYFPPRWLTPYFFLTGILVMVYLNPKCHFKLLKYFLGTLILFSIIISAARFMSFTLWQRAESDSFLPNKRIAHAVNNLWHQHYQKPLPYVAGSNYLVSLVVPYIADKPKAYLNWSSETNPWINEQDLKHSGGIFIWDLEYNYTWDHDSEMHTHLPPDVKKHFPKIQILDPLVFYRSSDHHPIKIGIALLPPS